MAIYKDKNGTWYVSARYTDWKGESDRKVKRGFKTKREAAEWEKNFFLENAGNLDMSFEAFYQLYKRNTQDRIKLNTWKTKESVIEGNTFSAGNVRICFDSSIQQHDISSGIPRRYAGGYMCAG
jgi:hypothetical protein